MLVDGSHVPIRNLSVELTVTLRDPQKLCSPANFFYSAKSFRFIERN